MGHIFSAKPGLGASLFQPDGSFPRLRPSFPLSHTAKWGRLRLRVGGSEPSGICSNHCTAGWAVVKTSGVKDHRPNWGVLVQRVRRWMMLYDAVSSRVSHFTIKSQQSPTKTTGFGRVSSLFFGMAGSKLWVYDGSSSRLFIFLGDPNPISSLPQKVKKQPGGPHFRSP